MPASEHKRHSARAPTVPFQMVTRRRGAQARSSGGSDEHAMPPEELASAREKEPSLEATAPPTHVGIDDDDSEYEPHVDGSEQFAGESAAGETPRRSSRVVPRKVVQAAKKPTLIIKFRIPPDMLSQFDVSPVEPFEHQAEELSSPISRSKRAKPVTTDESTQPPSSAPPVADAAAEESPVGTPVARQKRQRKPKVETITNTDEAGAADPVSPEEERPVKRRRKTKVDGPVVETAPTSPTPVVPEPTTAAVPPSLAATPVPAERPSSPAVIRPIEANGDPDQQAPTEPDTPTPAPTPAPAPEDPPQKRRGRPPKSELLKRRLNKPLTALTTAPAPPPAGPLMSKFRAGMPQGLQMLDFISLAQHTRDKNLLAKKKPMKRLIKRGYRVEHRVTREWCTQRNQRLAGQQRKLDRHLRRANAGLLDQTINLVQNSQDYLSEKGPAAPFWLEGLRVSEEHRKKLIAQAEYRRDIDIELAESNLERNLYLRRRQFASEVVGALERLAAQKACISRAIIAFYKDHPDEVDAIIERCELSGDHTEAAIIDAACESEGFDFDAEMSKIESACGFGLGNPLLFSDRNAMDLDDDIPPVVVPAEGGGGEETDQLPVSDENAMDVDEEVPPVVLSAEREDIEEKEATPLPSEELVEREPTEEPQQTADLEALVGYAGQEIDAMKEQAVQEGCLDVLAFAAAERDPLPKKDPLPKMSEEPAMTPVQPSPAPSDYARIPTSSMSPPPSFAGSGSADEKSSIRAVEELVEPGFALSGPAPPPDVLKPSSLYQEPELRSRFTGSGDSRRWTESRMFPVVERPVFSPLQTHHHYLPGVSPPPIHGAGSNVPLPPPSAMPSPGRLLPSPVPTTRFPAAYQAVSGRSPSPSIFNPLPHDPRYRGEQGR
ncbi:hypothetical protein DRE_03000 [Drechslerella stenobrocha 248]|uniref:Uncharacterized protein n=1 Tax=Drechslerella stenobrocha 248 TaxID=1043628 RepID=W7IFB6_9PEZI|nr:hypothetical protein DRE_03000 [Drechslerella stenobrocha 248]